MIKAFEGYLNERLNQHRENLRLWDEGYLSPTEPDEGERRLIRERLTAVICELEHLLKASKEY